MLLDNCKKYTSSQSDPAKEGVIPIKEPNLDGSRSDLKD
jgi:hypothetical protein